MRFRSRESEEAERVEVLAKREEAKRKLTAELRSIASLIELDTVESRAELRDHVDGYWKALSLGAVELREILDEDAAALRLLAALKAVRS